MRVAIPQKFKLGGRTWKVVVIDGLEWKGEECLGLTLPNEAVIALDSGQSDECMHHTFYHELVHALCSTLGWGELNADEDKVDALGGLLLQYLKTKKGRTDGRTVPTEPESGK